MTWPLVFISSQVLLERRLRYGVLPSLPSRSPNGNWSVDGSKPIPAGP